MSLSPMLHVKFKKCPCRAVDFRDLGPYRSLLPDVTGTSGNPVLFTHIMDSEAFIVPGTSLKDRARWFARLGKL